MGRITGFGSIYINGNEFNTDGTVIVSNGDIAAEGDLEIGMKVVVWATNAAANTVEYESEIRGNVEFVDAVNGTLTVMGQPVIFDSTTVFRTVNSLRELKQNDHVDVSGYIDAFGNIRAGFIKRNANGPYEYQVKGFVSNHDPVNMNFAINDLTVDYSRITMPPAIGDGYFVNVKGMPTGIVFRASGLELEDEVRLGSPGQIVEVEGFVTAVYSQNDFEVNGQRVFTDGVTVFRNGTSANIALNARVVVKGTVDADGIIVADEVTFDLWQAWQGEAAEIRGFVESVDVANSRLRLMGKTIYIDSSTSWRNISSLAALSPGDLVNIVGSVGIGGSLTADWVEWRSGSAPDDYLNGPVDLYSENLYESFSILGITVDVSGGDVSFRDRNGVHVDAATFFGIIDDSLSPGEMVAVEGVYENSVLRAQVVEIGNLI